MGRGRLNVLYVAATCQQAYTNSDRPVGGEVYEHNIAHNSLHFFTPCDVVHIQTDTDRLGVDTHDSLIKSAHCSLLSLTCRSVWGNRAWHAQWGNSAVRIWCNNRTPSCPEIPHISEILKLSWNFSHLVRIPDMPYSYGIAFILYLVTSSLDSLYCWRWVSSTVFSCDSSLLYV